MESKKKIIILLFLTAYATRSNGLQLIQKALYPQSEGPTMIDYGENEAAVIGREADQNDLNQKSSGWVNPLSITDDGKDDDLVLDMHFKPLDEAYTHYTPPSFKLDSDILASMESEKWAEVNVKKNKARWQEQEKKKKEAAIQATKNAIQKQKQTNVNSAKNQPKLSGKKLEKKQQQAVKKNDKKSQVEQKKQKQKKASVVQQENQQKNLHLEKNGQNEQLNKKKEIQFQKQQNVIPKEQAKVRNVQQMNINESEQEKNEEFNGADVFQDMNTNVLKKLSQQAEEDDIDEDIDADQAPDTPSYETEFQNNQDENQEQQQSVSQQESKNIQETESDGSPKVFDQITNEDIEVDEEY